KEPRTWYTLSNARQARRRELAQVHGSRHRIEELLEEANQEVGLSHYEVRSWVGWHHHMALSLLALWFLQLERLRLGGKNAGGDGGAGAGGVHRAAPRAGPPPTRRGAREAVSGVVGGGGRAPSPTGGGGPGSSPPRRPRPGPRPSRPP